ncbi:T9SS type A sorting domain-containing protein [Flavobacterium sp. 316]|uniref:T9SS type A sorting domain-containing protein n=1 Tax=Flavobacterium sp. 316 TaxID=1603293 RepID=UPI0006987AF9|nr:T9SS type A sorting domain-containing protein [Flavobacterium sp. 316]
MKKLYFLSLILISSLSYSQILSDDFNYTDGDLLTNNGWSAFSGTGTQSIDVGTANGLVYSDYSGTTGFTAAVEGNAAQLDNTGEDVNKTFTAVTSGAIYYSFLVNVNSGTTGYFAGLNTTGTTFGNRVFVKPSSTAGKINFGISNTSTANYSTTDFDLNTTYLIIVKYDVTTTGSYSMWVKTSGVPATEVAAGSPEVTNSGSGSATISGFFFRQYSATQNLTIDGLRMYSTWFNTTPCDLVLDAESTNCDAITTSLDTYTATIPFTGGGTASYTLNTTSGTISGDDPSSSTSGNIIISGVTETTDITLTISGGCNIVKNISSPECKPINTLPYNEPFNYTVGNSLGLEQMWTNVNTGDDIVIASGSLTYESLVGTGNSASFAGTGIDCFTPFTSTTNGTLYAGFMFSVTDLSGVTDTNETYFAVLTDAAQSFQARLFTKKVGTQYQVGFDSASTTTNYDVTLRNEGDVVYVIIGYDFTGNVLNAWINPDLSTFNSSTPATLTNTPTAAITELGGFLLRQQADVNTPAITFDELKITVNDTDFLSTNSFNTIEGLTMYPNPVSGNVLHFSSTANANMSVQIFDIVGKEVINTKVINNTINTANLNAGMYIVKITEEGKTATRKLVVK